LNRQGAKSRQEHQARNIDKILSELGDLGVLAVNFSRVESERMIPERVRVAGAAAIG
jgi:hypothetical protein